MSRLIVFSLSPNCQVQDLRNHFKNINVTITDARVLYKPDGTSRRTAFIGFRSDDDAKTAKEWADGSYLAGSRISVDYAKAVKDAPAPRKRQRMSQQESISHHEIDLISEPSKSEKSDTRFNEFLSVMRPNRNRLQAETLTAPQPTEPHAAPMLDTDNHKPNEQAEDTIAEDTGISDLEYMKRRMKNKMLGEEQNEWEQDDEDKQMKDDDDNGKVENPANDPEDVQQNLQVSEDQLNRESILESSRIFLRNLPYTISEEELIEKFSTYGEIDEVHQPPGKPGLAYIRFKQPHDAVSAYESLDGEFLQGRLLHILPAINKNQRPGSEDTVKQSKDKLKKKEASREWNWGSLYMNHDAVVNSMADRLGISKSDMLDAEEGGEAVRVALAETTVIEETKKWFENHGFKFNETSAKTKRSKKIIFVKNIPYGTSPPALRALFSVHGKVERVLIPPAGTIAIVEMLDEKEAKIAFRSLAYHQISGSIMYLEWAPETTSVSGEKKNDEGPSSTARKADKEAPEGERGATLFIKNLSFSTTSEVLAKAFEKLGDFAFARVQTKPNPKEEGGKLSMGFGFVGFKSVESAEQARKAMEGFELDGHAIQVKYARQHQATDVGESDVAKGDGKVSKGTTTKLLVKNLPFEASKKDVRQLFGSYGQLKSLRLPRKFDNRTRGFAFLEFVSRTEAENAYKALQHTHLLGRHLVLEWSDEGDAAVASLDMLRDKAKKDVQTSQRPQLQKKKMRDIEQNVGNKRKRHEEIE